MLLVMDVLILFHSSFFPGHRCLVRPRGLGFRCWRLPLAGRDDRDQTLTPGLMTKCFLNGAKRWTNPRYEECCLSLFVEIRVLKLCQISKAKFRRKKVKTKRQRFDESICQCTKL